MKQEIAKAVTLRRDGKGPLKFNGVRIGSASRNQTVNDDNQTGVENGIERRFEISSRLFRTSAGKYILGIEVYNRTDEEYRYREALKADSLQALAAEAKGYLYIDDDILAEVFQDTEIADQFIEHVD